MATKTTVIIITEAVFIWAIPPLLPQPFDHNPTHIPLPLFKIPFPDIYLHPTRIRWKAISSWYCHPSKPLYFDILCLDSKLHRFQILLDPDLSTASLLVIKISEHTPYDFHYLFSDDYRVCEDTLVSSWLYDYRLEPIIHQYGVYTGSTSTRSDPAAKMLLPENFRCIRLLRCCPASGRLVFKDINDCISVVDLF